MKNPKPRTAEKKAITFDYPIQHTFKLPAAISAIPARFDEVILKRKSARDFSGITLEQLSDLLWYTAKVKNTFVQDNGYVLTHRGTPSAGARHPLDILIINEAMFNSNLPHYYNPFEHSLSRLEVPGQTVKDFVTHVDGVVPIAKATIIWFVAHPDRTAAKYENPESLIWRDAGALINSVQLTSTALNINCCPLGTLGEPFISDLFNRQDDVFGVGGVLIG